ncbi:peptidylprolyl isomerase [Cohnella xylanilytica]|uniref:peptidylprolyl isomerase n=1 Tax=Cohnella xylanilytica TaxID=557555 RepID=UPI001B1B9D91|nr:peptidylprolyl isomerase [Cohnella xylanilytica]GIO15828.1 peptidylprolyl isomerase [Cohnella xylanilytica]
MLHPKRGPSSRFAFVLLALALLVGLAAGCGKKENKIAAEYEGGQITTKEFTAYKTFMKIVNPTYGSIVDEDSVQETILTQFVGFRVLSARATDEAKKQGKDEADKQFEEMKKQITADADTKKTIEQMMKDGGLSYDKMKLFMEEQFIMYKDADLKVKDEDISSYYEKNKDKFKYATVRHILIGLTDKNNKTRTDADALKLANEVKGKLEAGGDWKALAKEYSDDPGSADNGGLYEKVDPSQWVEEFKNAANTQPIGQIGDPVKTSYGYHVIKVEARGTKTLDEAKAEIRSTLASDSIGKYMTDELPKLIKKTNVPKPSASPSPSASASASPSASASGSPSASPTPSASPSASAPASK